MSTIHILEKSRQVEKYKDNNISECEFVANKGARKEN